MGSLDALLKKAPDIARALEGGDPVRAGKLLQQRFPQVNPMTVLTEFSRLESLKAACALLEAGDLEGAINRLGRNDAPTALRDWFEAGRVNGQQMRSVLLSVWGLVEYPCRALPRRTWLDWFELVGFVSDGAPMPTEPVELWRAQVGRVMGLAWSRERERAVWFYERNALCGLPGRLLHTLAPPASMLGIIDEGRGEREAIVHPHRITFSEESSNG